MWKLRCGDNEKIVQYTNVIGRSEVRSFFTSNGSVIPDDWMDSIRGMKAGETLRFPFPNGVKCIEVEAI